MFQFVGGFKKIEFRGSRYSKQFVKALETQHRQAARAFLRAVILKVPVYSGMARGSLRPLGRFLRVNVPIRPKPDAKKKHPNKNPEEGEKMGRFEFTNAPSGLNPSFTLTTEVLHFLTNEFYGGLPEQRNLKHPTPWNARTAGRKAYKAYLKQNLKRKVPKISRYLSFVKTKRLSR